MIVDMNASMNRLFALSLIVYLDCVIGFGITQAKELSAPGIYSLIEVNGQQLPAVSWTRKSNSKHCKEEVLEGAMFLDSEGHMTVFVTTRDICVDGDGLEAVVKEASTIFPGTYRSIGNKITFRASDNKITFRAFSNKITMQFELGGDPSHVDLKGQFLVLKEEGIGDYEGQKSEFVFKKETN